MNKTTYSKINGKDVACGRQDAYGFAQFSDNIQIRTYSEENSSIYFNNINITEIFDMLDKKMFYDFVDTAITHLYAQKENKEPDKKTPKSMEKETYGVHRFKDGVELRAYRVGTGGILFNIFCDGKELPSKIINSFKPKEKERIMDLAREDLIKKEKGERND